MEAKLDEIRQELKEDNRLLHEIITSKADVLNTILAVVGVLLALAGVIGLVYSVLADKKLMSVKNYLGDIGTRVKELHASVVNASASS